MSERQTRSCALRVPSPVSVQQRSLVAPVPPSSPALVYERSHRRKLSRPPKKVESTPVSLRRHYSDASKPRPLLRGAVHGLMSVGLIVALLCLRWRMPQLSLALLLKLCTYACSATFHLFPFPNMKHETRKWRAPHRSLHVMRRPQSHLPLASRCPQAASSLISAQCLSPL